MCPTVTVSLRRHNGNYGGLVGAVKGSSGVSSGGCYVISNRTIKLANGCGIANVC